MGPRIKNGILWKAHLGVLVFLKRNSTALYSLFWVHLFMCVSQQTFVELFLCAGLGLRNAQESSGHERILLLVKH